MCLLWSTFLPILIFNDRVAFDKVATFSSSTRARHKLLGKVLLLDVSSTSVCCGRGYPYIVNFSVFYISPLSAVLFIAIAKINFKSPSRDARCHFPSAIYFQRLLFSFCLIFVFIYLHFQCFCLQYLLKLYSQPFSHECDAMVKNTSWGLHRLSDQDIRLTDSVTNQQMMFTPPRHLIPPLVFQLPMFALSWCCILYGIRHYSASSLVHMPVRKYLTSTKSMGLRQTTLTVRENV